LAAGTVLGESEMWAKTIFMLNYDEISGAYANLPRLQTHGTRMSFMASDDILLNFDVNRLADKDRLDTAALLGEHGDLYRNHLAIALWISGWRERLNDRPRRREEPGRFNGEDYALGEIAAHLRQGDFLPGHSFMLDDEDSDGRRPT
jgi:hypothetical protein